MIRKLPEYIGMFLEYNNKYEKAADDDTINLRLKYWEEL